MSISQQTFSMSVGFADLEVSELIYRVDQLETAKVESLLKAGCDSTEEFGGVTALFVAAKRGSLPILQLLGRYGAIDDLTETEFDRCVSVAITSSQKDIFDWWASRCRPQLEKRKGRYLIKACEAHSLDIAVALLAMGADPNFAESQESLSSLQVATQKLYVGIIKELLKAGGSPQNKNAHGKDCFDILRELKGLNKSDRRQRDEIESLFESVYSKE